jgi:hypothetical protein
VATRHCAVWRRSGESGAEFAHKLGVLETTLRSWAWRLASQGEEPWGDLPVSFVPVQVVGEDNDMGAQDAEARATALAWTLRTARGDLRVYASDCDLAAIVAALVGGKP